MAGRTEPVDWEEEARRLCSALSTLLYALEGPEDDRPPLADAIEKAHAAKGDFLVMERRG